MTRLAVGMLLVGLSASGAAAQWTPWPSSPESPPNIDNPSPPIAAAFKHDDGGKLFVICDTGTKLISIGVEEPRARWQPGTTMDVTTRADTGASNGPSHGVVIDSTRLIIKEQSTRDLSTMRQAKAFFVMDAGGYARTYPTDNFRKVVDPVLAACGGHF
jgi:hypothetical protein